MRRNDWLEDEEDEIRANLPRFQPSEESGLVSFGTVAALAAARMAMAPDCESPIEAMLGARLKLLIEQWNKDHAPKLELVPQYPLLRFRYDFGIVFDGSRKLVAAIECDGKDYHSSNEAKANDAAKNLAVWAREAEIFRFTGSDIFRRGAECAAAVEDFLLSKFKDG